MWMKTAKDCETAKMILPPTPNLPEVLRLVLLKIEGTKFPTQDPASIEAIKVHLRSRIAALETGDVETIPAPNKTKKRSKPAPRSERPSRQQVFEFLARLHIFQTGQTSQGHKSP
jgi:hypothetical protein